MSTRTKRNSRRMWTLHAYASAIRPALVILMAWHGLQVWTNSALAQSLHFTRLKDSTSTCAQAQSSVQEELRARGFFFPF